MMAMDLIPLGNARILPHGDCSRVVGKYIVSMGEVREKDRKERGWSEDGDAANSLKSE